MIPSPNSSSRNGARVRLIAVHTAEGALTATSLGSYFANAASQVSSHLGVDADSVQQYVDFDRAAWTIRSANPISENIELCGFAEMTREQWLSEQPVTFHSAALNRTITVNRPAAMLRRAAAAVRERCQARGIPMVKLTAADVAAGKAGVIGHVDWTVGMHDGDHRDPGPGFPWPEFMAAVNGSAAPVSPDAPNTEDESMPIELTFYNDNWQPDPAGCNFRASCPAEVGDGSQVIAAAWVRWFAAWGPCSWRVVAWSATKPIGESDPSKDYYQLPDGVRGFTVEGRRANAGVQPSASLLIRAH